MRFCGGNSPAIGCPGAASPAGKKGDQQEGTQPHRFPRRLFDVDAFP
jgi:hypothetical protein